MVRVAIIGAGASGLTSIKACKESNFDVTCYEWSDSIGGIWNYKDKPIEGMGSVDRTTIINTSKEFLAFSDFPFPENYPNFMRHTYVLKYLNLYAKKFSLLDCIKFNHKVTDIAPADDYESTGKWKIVAENEKRMQIEEDVDAVMVCTGHHGYPLKVRFKGDDKFRGSIIHNHSYKDPNCYKGKRVLIVGLGNSGGDVAVDVSGVAEKTYLSTRKGSWIFKRMEKYGEPYDLQLVNRLLHGISGIIPFNWACSYLESSANEWFDQKKFQVKPRHRILEQQFTVNDFLPNKVLSGEIIIKGDILRFEENGIVFEGEDEVTEIDDVILTTGYKTKFPFIREEILQVKDNQVGLYKLVYPPHLKHSTFGMIGLLDGLIGTFPILEIQARWFVQVLKGKVSLPSEAEMRRDIVEYTKRLRRRFYKSPRHNMLVDISYLDEISSLIGVKPNFCKMFFEDPILWFTLMWGPNSPYQYRLAGVHSWPAARRTILSYKSRVWAPLQTRFRDNEDENFKLFKILPIFFILVAVAIVCFLS